MLEGADRILLMPHIMVDGDGLGSAAALCMALRHLNKTAWIVLEDKVADHLMFLKRDLCVQVEQCPVQQPDVTLCIDCGEEGRFPKRKELFRRGNVTVCIDHHPTSEGIADLNYIDAGAAATGELIYDLIRTNDWPLDRAEAEGLFAAIATDTGNYMYSNTTRRSHEITCELMDTGLDCNAVSVALYENESIEKMMLQGKMLSTIRRFANGQGVIAMVTQKMLKDTGAGMEDTDGFVSLLRSLKGVEIAILLKEQAENMVKVTMRAKRKGDVAAIASRHGGGGHVKAAGCTIRSNLKDALPLLMREAAAALEQETV